MVRDVSCSGFVFGFGLDFYDSGACLICYVYVHEWHSYDRGAYEESEMAA